MAIPYAPSRLYQPDSSIIDIILQSGRDRAQLQRASGQNLGNAVSGLGQIVSNTIRDIADGKAQMAEQKRKAEMEAPKLADEAKIRGLSIQKLERETAQAARADVESAGQQEARAQARQAPSRLKALDLLANDPEGQKELESFFERKDKAKALEFGDAAAMIRRFGDSDEAVNLALENFVEDGYDKAMVEQIGQQLKDPSRRGQFIDSFLSASPDAGHRALVTKETKPDTRSLALQLNEALQKGDKTAARNIQEAIRLEAAAGRAPVAPKDPVYREIEGKTYQMQGARAVPVDVPRGTSAAEAPTPAEAPFINQPGYAKLPNAAKVAVTSMNNFIQAAENYRNKLDELTDSSGVNLTGEDAADLDAEHAALLFTAAKAFEQGALQAPDKAVVEQMIPNPAKWSSLFKTLTHGGKAGQLRAMDTSIANFKARMKSTWGLSPTKIGDSQAPLEKGTTVPPPDASRPRAQNPKTGAIVEWNGSAWIPVK